MTVDGSGSMWTNSSSLYVGNAGRGTLNIVGGGQVANTYGYVGYSSGSTGDVTVAGNGSKWSNSSDLLVGRLGSGTLDINAGALVTNKTGSIGDSSGSAGEVTITGTGSKWASSLDLYVGRGGTGMLNIGEGSTVSVGGSTYVAYGSGASGSITMDKGSTLSVGGNTYVAYYSGASGSITMDNGTLTTKSLLALSSQLRGSGTINTRGIVSDADLLFDSTHGLSCTFALNAQPDQNITVNLDISKPNDVGDLGIGNQGIVSLTVREGMAINSQTGYVGDRARLRGDGYNRGCWFSMEQRIPLRRL